MASVLIVDDEPRIVSALTYGLSGEGLEISSAGTGEQGLAALAGRVTDLVVLDLGLPDVDGVDVVRRLRVWSDVPVLILSGAGAEARKVEALDAGADDYLEKPFGLDELCARLRALLRRAAPRPPGAAPAAAVGVDGLVIDAARKLVTRDQHEVRLTPKEWQLLEALLAHPGELLPHSWLIQHVWGRSYGDEARQTLRAHLRTLRAKLGDDAGAPRLVRTEIGAGYRWLIT